MTSIAQAVAAIPEGLPGAVSVTLTIGMHRTAKNRALVKKLAAVEALRSTTARCSDKTGIATLNQTTAGEVYFRGRHFALSDEGDGGESVIGTQDDLPLPGFAPVLTPAALCTDSSIRHGKLIGDPTQAALLALAGQGGDSRDGDRDGDREIGGTSLSAGSARIADIPFDSAHKFRAWRPSTSTRSRSCRR